MNEIKTETQWGNNIIINVNVIVKDGKLPGEHFFAMLKRKLFEAINSSEHGRENWVQYQKVGLDGGVNVFGHLPEKRFSK